MSNSTPTPVDAKGNPVEADVAKLLGEILSLLKSGQVLNEYWRKVLTEAQRVELGGDLDVAWREFGIVGMWLRLHESNDPYEAVLNLARSLDCVSQADDRWLRRELKIPPYQADPIPHEKPIWHPERGELWFKGRRVRKVRKLKNTSWPQILIEEFARLSWPPSIRCTFCNNPEELHNIVNSTNSGLDGIRFHGRQVDEGQLEIVWSESELN